MADSFFVYEFFQLNYPNLLPSLLLVAFQDVTHVFLDRESILSLSLLYTLLLNAGHCQCRLCAYMLRIATTDRSHYYLATLVATFTEERVCWSFPFQIYSSFSCALIRDLGV